MRHVTNELINCRFIYVTSQHLKVQVQPKKVVDSVNAPSVVQLQECGVLDCTEEAPTTNLRYSVRKMRTLDDGGDPFIYSSLKGKRYAVTITELITVVSRVSLFPPTPLQRL